MLTHVLVPLDGSVLAEKALDSVRHILQPNGQITLLSAIQQPNPPVYAYPSPDVLGEIQHDIVQIENAGPHAKTYLDHVAKNLSLKGYLVRTYVRTGDPADRIVELAGEVEAEAIVMCTHGRSGLSRWLFGSVTQNVLGLATCPVFVIPSRESVRTTEAEQVSQTRPRPA